jgi:hypothetical protein
MTMPMACDKTVVLRSLALSGALILSGCLTTVPENGVCGLSNLSGQYAFPVRAGLAYQDPQANKYVVWLWDVYDAGIGNDNSAIAEDWGSYCSAIAKAGYSSGQRPPQRTLVLTMAPPLEGAHQGPPTSGVTVMTASYYEQADMSGVAATASSFDVTTTDTCVSGPLQLTFPDAGAGSVLTGQVNVPFCGPSSGGNGDGGSHSDGGDGG